MLKFSNGNAKLGVAVAIFDLPAGHSCPFAKLCRSSADQITGKITDGKFTEFRCYAASAENYRTSVRNARWHNFKALKGKRTSAMASLISASLPEALRYRIHSSGDFFSQAYFDAWLAVARKNPSQIFYAYTKAIPFWLARLGAIPSNVILTASFGGTHDQLIKDNGLKYAQVVFSEEQAAKLGLEIDHDDSHAWQGNKPFALLIHGTQPAGSEAGKQWYKLRKSGKAGYNRKTRGKERK